MFSKKRLNKENAVENIAKQNLYHLILSTRITDYRKVSDIVKRRKKNEKTINSKSWRKYKISWTNISNRLWNLKLLVNSNYMAKIV